MRLDLAPRGTIAAGRYNRRATMPLTLGARIGPYEVLSKLGEGGPPPLVHDVNAELRRGLAGARMARPS